MNEPLKCPHCGSPLMPWSNDAFAMFACDTWRDGKTWNQSSQCKGRELAQLREKIAGLEERWRLIGDWFAESDVSDEAFSIAWRNGYDHAIVDAQERYNSLTLREE